MSLSWKQKKKNIDCQFYLSKAYLFGLKYRHEEILHTIKIGIYLRLQMWHILILINKLIFVTPHQQRICMLLMYFFFNFCKRCWWFSWTETRNTVHCCITLKCCVWSYTLFIFQLYGFFSHSCQPFWYANIFSTHALCSALLLTGHKNVITWYIRQWK